MIKHLLPDFYQSWFPKKLLSADVQEKKATCENCAMSPEYNKNLKCCTYHPYTPNYLVGGFLSESRTPAFVRETVQKKIDSRQYVLPIGIVAPVPHQVEFNHRKKTEFGNREDWLCPYYNRENQNCGIWKMRGAVCTTFHCYSSYGDQGKEFWDRFSDYLTYVEMALMEEALVQLDFSPRQISENLEYLNRFEATPEELKQSVLPEKLARKLWNGYYADQIGFFKRCHEIVSNMNKSQFLEAVGEQGAMIEKNLLGSLRKLDI